MADFERRQYEIGLEFVRWSFAESNNFSEGSSESKKDAQVIRVRGAAPRVFNSNYLFERSYCTPIITLWSLICHWISGWLHNCENVGIYGLIHHNGV